MEYTGKVKWFNDAKGYGFVEGPSGEDLFVHYKNILSTGYRSLREGEIVTGQIVETEKGKALLDVRLCDRQGMTQEEAQAIMTAVVETPLPESGNGKTPEPRVRFRPGQLLRGRR